MFANAIKLNAPPEQSEISINIAVLIYQKNSIIEQLLAKCIKHHDTQYISEALPMLSVRFIRVVCSRQPSIKRVGGDTLAQRYCQPS